MADTKTAEALSQEVEKKDFGIYNQGRIKLNYNEETQDWSEQYEPVKGYKMFIPPVPQQVKLPTDVTVPDTPAVDTPTTEITQPAEPIVQPRDSGESAGERRRREDMERFGPGQDPMTFSKTMSSIFTPGTEQNLYYSTRNILKQEGDKLTVNFDMIDEAGGYGLPSLLGGVLKGAEKDIIENTVNKLRYAGIIQGNEVEDAKGIYEFTVDRDKMNKYNENVSSLANKLTGGYRDETGVYRQRNDYLVEELAKLGKDEATKFIADMAVLSDNDNMKDTINRAIDFGTKGAAAALITFQQGSEPLDLEATGLFGFAKYNDAFKEAYTNTLEQLQQAEGEESKEDKVLDTTRDTKAGEGTDAKAQELLDELNTLLKDKDRKSEPNRVKTPTGTKSAQGLTSTQKEALAGSGGFASKSTGTKKGTGSSGPPGRDFAAPSTKKGTGASGPPGRNFSTKSNTNKSNTNKSTGSTGSASSTALGKRGF